MLEKPEYGDACNNCGRCCLKYQCPTSVAMFGKTARCPALEQDGERYLCGLVASPGRYQPIRTALAGVKKMRDAALVLIGHGTGCDAVFAGEIANEAYRKSKRDELEADPFRLPSPTFLRALALWGLLK